MIFRPVFAVARQTFRPRIETLAEPVAESFRVKPADIDLFRHLNHARYLNYMEVARWGMMARLGFLRLSLRRRWIAPLGAVHVEYYRPLGLWQRFEVRTRFVRFEERWFHVLHSVVSGEKEAARALVRGTVRRGRENVPPEEYLSPLGLYPPDVHVPAELAEWVRRAMLANGDEVEGSQGE